MKAIRNFRIAIARKISSGIHRVIKFSQNEEYQIFRRKYDISESSKFNGDGIKLYGGGEIVIGDHTYIGQFSFLQSAEGYKIEIGRNCAISHNVKIYTTSYVSDQDFNQVERKTHNSNVKIGDGVWIGVNVLINPGITIGANAIIGANSVVTKDIPAFAIAGGVPARVIRLKEISGA